ncbi:MAG TPA: hypothetical protein VKE74_00950 [Gemmataceae bacterium]|nr:hypothetical protein [Gemmataceae bacterium]
MTTTTTTNGTHQTRKPAKSQAPPKRDTSDAQTDARQRALAWWVTAIGIVQTLQCQATDLMIATGQPDSPVFHLFRPVDLNEVRLALDTLLRKFQACTPNPGLVDTELLPDPV